MIGGLGATPPSVNPHAAAAAAASLPARLANSINSWSTGAPNQSATMSSTVAAAASGGAGQRDLGGMVRKRPSVGISEGKWPELTHCCCN